MEQLKLVNSRRVNQFAWEKEKSIIMAVWNSLFRQVSVNGRICKEKIKKHDLTAHTTLLT